MKSFTTQINRGGHILFTSFTTDVDAFEFGIKSIDMTQGTTVLVEAKTFDHAGNWQTVAGLDVEWTASAYADNRIALEQVLATPGAVRFEATLFLGNPSI